MTAFALRRIVSVMNPGDFLLLLLSVALAAAMILANGWTITGVGPAAVSVAAGLWQLWMQWLRHRSYLRHRNSGFVPPTQGLNMLAFAGWLLGTAAALIWGMQR